jgi:hypothetical protein
MSTACEIEDRAPYGGDRMTSHRDDLREKVSIDAVDDDAFPVGKPEMPTPAMVRGGNLNRSHIESIEAPFSGRSPVGRSRPFTSPQECSHEAPVPPSWFPREPKVTRKLAF